MGDKLSIRNPLTTDNFTVGLYTLANPAAGADVSSIAFPFARTQLLWLHIKLVTDANVASRVVRLDIHDNTIPRTCAVCPSDIGASSTSEFVFCAGGGEGNASAEYGRIIPISNELIIETPWYFETNILNMQATDQISDVWFSMKYWHDPY
jgi:hypothetical protein